MSVHPASAIVPRGPTSAKDRRFPAYRDTGTYWLGQVPRHWTQKRLRFCTRLINNKVEAAAVSLPYVGLENIESGTGHFLPTIGDQTTEGVSSLFAAGDVLFGKLRPYLAKVLHAESEGVCSSELLVLRGKEVLPRYLFYYLLSPEFINVVDSSTFGAKMPRASWDFIGNLPLLLPPEDEQNAVATFLDHETTRVDNLIARKQQLIDLLSEERATRISRVVTNGMNSQAAMTDSGVPWLGRVPAHWKIVRLKRVLAAADYGISDSLKESGEVAVLRMGNLQDGELSVADLRYVDTVAPELVLKDKDILFNRTNSLALIGKTALFHGFGDTKVSFASYLVRFRTNDTMDPAYLCLLLNRPETLERARSLALPAIGQANLNPSRYGYVHVCVPPLPEQTNIVEHVRQESARIDGIASQVQNAITRLREYRSALIAAAVTGQIDVRNYRREAPCP